MSLLPLHIDILIARKVGGELKLGGLAVFKSANIFAMSILGPTTKLNSRQYFRLYGTWASTRSGTALSVECPQLIVVEA